MDREAEAPEITLPRKPRDGSTSPTYDVVGSDLDSGWCKGKAAKQEGGDTDVWWPGALGPVEEGRWGGGLTATRQLAAGLINATAANVAHPFDDIMVAVVQLRLKHLQVAHLEARGRKWHLKVHGNGRSSPLLLVVGGQKLNLCADL